MSGPRHRAGVLLYGTPEQTRREVEHSLATLADDAVLWVEEGARARFRVVSPRETKALLGAAFDVVVMDLSAGVDADALGRAHGLVWGGGRLVLRLPPAGTAPPPSEALAVHPYTTTDVGTRFVARLERCLARHPDAIAPAGPITPAPHDASGTREQAEVVRALVRTITADAPALATVLADRGRGKSSALGLALHAALADHALEVAVSAAAPSAAAEVFRFALGDPRPPRGGPVRFVTPLSLARDERRFDVVVIDEAAQLPVPLLQRITRRHARAKIVFATTAQGYEGTGRGFVLRFLEWTRGEARPAATYTLSAPVRFDAGDPLERLVFDALALDAEPASLEGVDLDAARPEELDRDALANDEALLREVFGLLVHAHYRTTPSDLERLLDAPNLRVHAMRAQGRVLAATLVAIEGGLPAALTDALARGTTRIRGHALADTLVCHAGRPEAGALRMIRSVRVATHPDARRRGLASALVEHVHARYAPDLFGTVFGATPALLSFRRALGYTLVRVGASRGARTGEPAAVMVRPVSPAATALVDDLRRDLARDLPLQLGLLDADGELRLDPELPDALRAELGPAAPLDDDALGAAIESYLEGPRPMESVVYALDRYVTRHREALARLAPRDRALLEGRVLARRPWEEVAPAAGFETVPPAMRALRRAVRALRDRVEGDPS